MDCDLVLKNCTTSGGVTVLKLFFFNILNSGCKQEQAKNSTIAYEPTPQQQPQQQPSSAITSTANPLSFENVDAATANLLNLMQWVTNANATFAAAVAASGGVGPPSTPLSTAPPVSLSSRALPSADEASALALDAAETAALLDPITASGGAPAPILYPNQCSGGSGGGANNGQSAFTASGSSSGYGRPSQQQQQPVSSSSSSGPLGGGWGAGGAGGQPPPMLPPNQPPGGSMQVSHLRLNLIDLIAHAS